jgi:hypothetical protein
VSLSLNPLPGPDFPALVPAGDRGGPVVEPKRLTAMVRFLDGTWRLCKVLGWRQDPGGWACHLQWGVSGRITDGWYRPDAEKTCWPGSPGSPSGLLAMAAAIWHNWAIGAPVKRSLSAYDH